jgi:hypothetical protein
VVAVVVAADAIWTRAGLRLRTRAAQSATKSPSHQLITSESRGGWRSIDRIGEVTGGGGDEIGMVEDSRFEGRFDSLINNNHRRSR